jgi:RecB family exonuclease
MRHFSHSSMSTWRRCLQRYQWQYIDNYGTPSGKGQIRGTIGHAALAEWYRNGNDDEKAMKLVSQMYCDVETKLKENFNDDWELMKIILPRYFEWARQEDNFEEIIALEQKFEILIGDQTLIGYIDGIVKSKQGTIWLLEHKFNKQVLTKHVDLDPQMSLYLLAVRKMGIEARGVLFNVVRVLAGGIAETQPVARIPVYRNQEGLELIEKETSIQLNEMAKFHEMHPDEQKKHVFRNPTKDCSWDCSFFQVCLSMNDDGTSQQMLDRFEIINHEEPITEKGEDGNG